MGSSTRTLCSAGCGKPSVGRRLCRAHYQAAWKAGTLGQHQKLPPRARARVICPADHKHAESSTCYIQHQCRCGPCRAAASVRGDRRYRLKAYGRWDPGLVDADPVRDHVLALSEYGLGLSRVAELAGVSKTGLRQLMWGRDSGERKGELPKRITREKAERILAVQAVPENLRGGAVVPARGVHRRLQALVARGWSLSLLGRRLGKDSSAISLLMLKADTSMATVRAVAALYDELWDQLPPRETRQQKASYTFALHYAEARRWLPPLAWDDIDSDEEPPVVEDEGGIDEVAVELACSGEGVRLSPAERRECVRRLHARKWSDARIAEALHCNPKTSARIRDELGLEAFDQNELVERGAA